MTTFLLDTNVLIAFAWENHPHHELVVQWLAKLEDQWATCPLTQSGLVRISSNPKSIPFALTPYAAVELLIKLTDSPKHVFWPDSIDLRSNTFLKDSLRGHQQVTDAYLVSLAVENGGRFATLDAGVPSIARTKIQRDAILLLAV